MVDRNELGPERRYIWTLYSLQRLIRMYGYDGDEDERMVETLSHGLACREAEHARTWVSGQSVDFSRYDPYNAASEAYERRSRLCTVEREEVLQAVYAVGCSQDGEFTFLNHSDFEC